MNAKDGKAIVGILVLLVILWAVASSRAQNSEPSSTTISHSRLAHFDATTGGPAFGTPLPPESAP